MLPFSARAWMPDNNARAERQQKLPIQVIVGNPPWSSGQRSSEDDNPNIDYPAVKTRIEDTYASRISVKGERHHYNTYKMAIRWASDRIPGKGVIAFVTNGSWIDSNVDAGIRGLVWRRSSVQSTCCTCVEINALRGNCSRREGGKVFGSGSRAPVAITILVKNPNAAHDGCRIHYRDIGDYLSREQKLEALKEARSISGFSDWREIVPDEHYDWIEKRSKVYTRFYPLGSDDSRASRTDDTVFGLYSLGLQTTKDAHMYNFSDAACAKNAGKLTETYLAAISDLEGNPELTLEEATRRNSSNIVWVSNLKEKLERKRLTKFDEACIRKVMFRPFILTNCYANYTFAISKYRMDQIFPEEGSENRAICVPGIGSTKPFSALMTDTMPDRHFNEACQCFPRYRYPKRTKESDATDKIPAINRRSSRIDNIYDTTLHTFREHYSDDRIMKDTIFDYVYGVMHAPTYREEFANDLSKELIPRIPFAPDFLCVRGGREKRLGNFTSVTRGVTDIHCSSYSRMRGNRCQVTID